MLKLLNAVLVLGLLGAGFMSYSLEHKTRGLERQISKLKREIDEERETIKLLKAEWSSLVRPERLQKLAEDNLELAPVKATQLVTIEELNTRVPAEPLVKLEEANKDPIGDIVKQMEQ